MTQGKSAPCETCGKSVSYTTKKPKFCSTCRTASKPVVKKTTGYKKRPDNKNTQGELILFKALDALLSPYDYVNHGYYSFLNSPKGNPLQLDRYYPDLKLAFEYDGKQHSEFSKYIHKTVKNFEYYKECDRLKEQACKAKGITLIRVAWNHKITEEALRYDIYKKNKTLHKRIFSGG